MVDIIWFDYLLITVMLISTVISLFRGFFKEALSLATWVIAIWLAWRFGVQFSGELEPWVTEPVLRLWLARVLIFVFGLLAGGLLSRLINILILSTGLTGTDRAIGMVFGFGRGVILVGLLIMVLDMMGFSNSVWWHESKLLPYAAPVADIIRHEAENGFKYVDRITMPEAI
ncbi:MAG: CvpA family protein [Gammaproteobacteria bacterium]|nr:CvpA family protein [Gammaproteobacteria bacterium]MCP4088891.1 CvpA family protein [Gammaproteobacteria bacterium]MCP4274907.1 CvpA family protein [Gammaproteobacteria bacterium]MCP4832026.1 CvpA family protein [Gammaproteobacteria bacterium]MCP4929461.1 CvpA family protein [Gammaproteobacteria bacterium]